MTGILGQVALRLGLATRKGVSHSHLKVDAQIWKHGIRLRVLRTARARRYLLRLQNDGTARLVIPRRGSREEAFRFLERNEAWLLSRYCQWQTVQTARKVWGNGTQFLYRGEQVTLQVEEHGSSVTLRFADQIFTAMSQADYRDSVRKFLREIAHDELPARTRELAQMHGISIERVTVRAQKTRWGSCSTRGTISLNWRVIQAPEHVRDYLIIHELMHRRQMNHSQRYWKLVAEACSDYRTAEQWLKRTQLDSFA